MVRMSLETEMCDEIIMQPSPSYDDNVVHAQLESSNALFRRVANVHDHQCPNIAAVPETDLPAARCTGLLASLRHSGAVFLWPEQRKALAHTTVATHPPIVRMPEHRARAQAAQRQVGAYIQADL